jgi:hypothetical protein
MIVVDYGQIDSGLAPNSPAPISITGIDPARELEWVFGRGIPHTQEVVAPECEGRLWG